MNAGRLSRILLIDDEPQSVALLVSYLRDRDVDILVALSGEDGLRKADEGQPDLILLDVRMPGLDGFELCRRLKRNATTAATPVLFLSASAAEADKIAGFAAGAVDYITKPFSQREVIARVMTHLATRRRMARLEAIALRRALRTSSLVEARTEARAEALFGRALSLLQRRIADPPTVMELAHHLGTNERKLAQLFRERVGMTVGRYVAELRLETARRLLEHSDMHVQLVAEQVGYRNSGDFIRAFRKRHGNTPRAYRSNCRSAASGRHA